MVENSPQLAFFALAIVAEKLLHVFHDLFMGTELRIYRKRGTPMFFNDWNTLGETVILATLAYIGVVLFLRISGKRTLAQMDAFDLVVTVAVGSILATVILDEKVVLVQGLTAVLTLVIMQVIASWLAIKSDTMSKLIKASPELLYYKGSYCEKTLKRNRILKEEILHAARSSSINSLDEVDVAVLEPDGNISFVEKHEKARQSTLSGVKGLKKTE